MRKTKSVQKVTFLAPDVTTKVIPAPTEGWDAISPLAEMDPKRAPILNNWVPRPGFVELRGGYNVYAYTGSSHPVETIMVYRSPTNETMFAAAGTAIYNASPGGLVTPAVLSGLSSARWQWVNFTPGGAATVIQIVNGVDTLRQWNGTAWSVPAITGLPGGTTANIININSHMRRLWYVMNQSTVVAFMPTDAITGPIAGTLDLGSLWSKGGNLVAMASWTIDGGTGPQAYALFMSSWGQVTIYSGTDPTNANNWALVGTFDVSPPIGRRCMQRVGSDVAIITQQGVIPISQALPFDPSADRSVAITARIQNAMAQASMTAQNNFGWQMLTYPNQQLAILNVPLTENTNQVQFVMNTLTGAWCQFLGWNANCFELYQNNLYWGDNVGNVNQGYIGLADGTTSIAADMQCAFNWLDEPGRVKRMTMVQPLLTLGGNLTPTIAVDTDFQTSTAVAPVTTFTGGTLWDVGKWDISIWPTLTENFIGWLSVDAIGHAMAIRMRANINSVGNPLIFGVFDLGTFDAAEFDVGATTTLPTLCVNAFNTISEMGGAI